MELLEDVVPREFTFEYMGTKAAKFLKVKVVSRHDSHNQRWPGKEKNVHAWWVLENGYAVGWNENPRGWGFPVVKLNKTNTVPY